MADRDAGPAGPSGPAERDAPGLDVLVEGPSPEVVRDLLRQVIDPELGLDIVELGLLRSVRLRGEVVEIRFTVTTPACPLSSYIEDEIRACLWQLPGVADLDVECVMQPPWTPEDMSEDARFALGWAS
jgi:metal-sulfur cluster biosynthetic enzyme